MAGPAITRAHRALIGVVAAGAFIIAGIGFTGSYAAVRTLALHKGFGTFSYVFPIGVDVGIAVLLALDLVLTWMRIPFPLLRQTAWLLTGATVIFNAASSWGDPLAMGMHAIIPVLFVVVVEAARHAIGRMADITADRHMESVRLMRWILSPVPTFRLWRRMKLWELRSYDDVVRLEQNRLVYRTHLRAQYGRNWRRQAPIETLLPLKLAKYGVPLDLDAIRRFPATQALTAQPEPVLVQTAPQAQLQPQPQPPAPEQYFAPAPAQPAEQHFAPAQNPAQNAVQIPAQNPNPAPSPAPLPAPAPVPAVDPLAVNLLTKLAIRRHRAPGADADAEPEPVPADPEFTEEGPQVWFEPKADPEPQPQHPGDLPGDPLDLYFEGLVGYRDLYNHDPAPAQLAEHLYSAHGVTAPGTDHPISAEALRRVWPQLEQRFLARYDEVAQ